MNGSKELRLSGEVTTRSREISASMGRLTDFLIAFISILCKAMISD